MGGQLHDVRGCRRRGRQRLALFQTGPEKEPDDRRHPLRRRFAVLCRRAKRRDPAGFPCAARPGGGRRLIYGSAVSVGNRPRKNSRQYDFHVPADDHHRDPWRLSL